MDKVIHGEGQAEFRLGNVPIPKLLGAGATYLDVLILLSAAEIAMLGAILWRYKEYREEEDFKKKCGITEKRSFVDHLIDHHRTDENDQF